MKYSLSIGGQMAGSITEDSNVYVDPIPCRNLGEAALQTNLVAIKRLIATPMANGRPIDPNDRGHGTAYGKLRKAEKKKGGEAQGKEGKEAKEADKEKAAGIAEAQEALANEVEDGQNPGQFWAHSLRGNCAPLWLAAAQGHTEIVSLLLGAKANAAWADEYEADTALHCAASWWGKESVARVLVEGGAPLNVVNKSGETPLVCAAANGYTAVCTVLLQAGADATVPSPRYGSALEAAESARKWSVVALLGAPSLTVEQAEEHGPAIEEVGFPLFFCDFQFENAELGPLLSWI